jgi:hypothetical protein
MTTWTDLVRAASTADIPAPQLRAVTLAQWGLESGWGKSELSRKHGNYAGLKWRPEMKGFATKVRYEAHDGPDDYCAFSTAEQFIKGYWRFIARTPYLGWETHASDPHAYVSFLKACGYAGDPLYVDKVMSLLPQAETMLAAQSLDTGGGLYQEEDRPSRRELGDWVGDFLTPADDPKFVTLSQVKQVFRGRRPKGIEGAIVHWDASRTRPVKGPDDLEWGARNTLQYGASQGHAYATIARSGTIYLPGNMDWQAWGYHAGPSKCPVTKREGVSQFYVGFEINCPGWLYPTPDPDLYIPWFNAVTTPKGEIVLNSKKQATVRNAAGVTYRRKELRFATTRTGNIAPGPYVPFTDAQQVALVNVLLWLKRTYPLTFRLDCVFGHDEVSPGRKVDPGASLGALSGTGPGEPMTMQQLRTRLLKTWADQQM